MGTGDVEVNIIKPVARAGAMFDGASTLLETDTLLISNDTDFSVSFWIFVKTSSFRLVIDGRDANDDGWNIVTQSNNTIRASLNTVDANVTNGDLPLKEWHQVTVVFDKSANISIYIDGVLKGTPIDISLQTLDNATNVTIGIQSFAAGNYLHGILTELRIWKRTLSVAEIINLFGGEVPKNNLVSEWLLKDDYKDTHGNNDLTNTNTVFQTVDSDVAAAVAADRTTSDDIYMIAALAGGEVATVVIDET